MRNSVIRALAPEITRQRLLIEGFYTVAVDRERVEDYLHGVAAHLGLRAYGTCAVFAPEGEGRQENQGFDAFLPLIDSGISVYVWTGSRFVAAVLFTCKAFDDDSAIAFTTDFFGLGELAAQAF